MTNLDIRNILITSSNFPKGSASANYLNLFCKGVKLSGRKIDVYILKGFFNGKQKISDSKRNLTSYGVKYIYLNFVNRPSNKLLKLLGDVYAAFCLILLLLSLLRRRKETTIFAYNNELYHSIILNCYCKLAGIKLVTFVPEYYDISEFSGNFTKRLRWYGFLLNFNYINRLSSRLIVFSHYIKSKYLEKKFPADKILVQPNLTDFDFWQSDNTDIEFTVGYSGSPYIKDGIEDLLTAIKILKDRDLKIKLIIIGDVVNEKSIIPHLKSFCKKIGIEDMVTFTGYLNIEEVKVLLNKCMVLAITRPLIVQTIAGFPTKIGEYFACRKIILSTKIGDIGLYFHDKQDLVFAEPNNPRSIADSLEWILNNRTKSIAIAENGYRMANELLNYTKIVPYMMQFVERQDNL